MSDSYIATMHDAVEALERRYSSHAEAEDEDYRRRQLAELARRFPTPEALQASVDSCRASAANAQDEVDRLSEELRSILDPVREAKREYDAAKAQFYGLQAKEQRMRQEMNAADKRKNSSIREANMKQQELDDVMAGKEKYFCRERKRLANIREAGGPSFVTLQESQRAIREAVDRDWSQE